MISDAETKKPNRDCQQNKAGISGKKMSLDSTRKPVHTEQLASDND